MVLTELHKPFVDRMCDDVMVVRARQEDPVEERFELKSSAHAPQLEIAEPQVSVRESSFLPERVQLIFRSFSHRRGAQTPHPGGQSRARTLGPGSARTLRS